MAMGSNHCTKLLRTSNAFTNKQIPSLEKVYDKKLSSVSYETYFSTYMSDRL